MEPRAGGVPKGQVRSSMDTTSIGGIVMMLLSIYAIVLAGIARNEGLTGLAIFAAIVSIVCLWIGLFAVYP